MRGGLCKGRRRERTEERGIGVGCGDGAWRRCRTVGGQPEGAGRTAEREKAAVGKKKSGTHRALRICVWGDAAVRVGR